MDTSPFEQSETLPIIPSQGQTLAPTHIVVEYFPAHGSFKLIIYEEGHLLVDKGAPSKHVVFELGRYSLSPRVVRELQLHLTNAIAAYEKDIKPLPSLDIFNEKGALHKVKNPPSKRSG